MTNLSADMVNNIIKKEYPNADNKVLARKLGIREQTLRFKASKLGIHKSEEFMEKYYLKLQENRRRKQEQNYKKYELTNIEKNIIVGSLLGDGTLSKYGRSLNACYRESTGSAQIPYRKWKAEKLSNLDFKINSRGTIYSPSHPIYTGLYKLFYPDGIKIIPKDGLKMLNHPIGLACLYMDDGSLSIGRSNLKRNTITICPSISLYSQSFTREENIMLIDHIHSTFGIEFKLANIPSGSGYHIRLGEYKEVIKFINMVSPYVATVPSMRYKVDLDEGLKRTQKIYSNKFPDKTIRIAKSINASRSYSTEEELEIIKMVESGFSYRHIAEKLNRSYHGIYDKVRRMGVKTL